MNWLKKRWLNLSLNNRKRIVSFLNTFVVTFLLLFATSINGSFPETWTAFTALLIAVSRSALREAINSLVEKNK